MNAESEKGHTNFLHPGLQFLATKNGEGLSVTALDAANSSLKFVADCFSRLESVLYSLLFDIYPSPPALGATCQERNPWRNFSFGDVLSSDSILITTGLPDEAILRDKECREWP